MNLKPIIKGVKQVSRFIFLVLYGTVAVLKTSYTLYLRYGFLKSAYLWKSIDGSGSPIPWFSYPALDYLNRLNISAMSVFEFGSGYSTLYWSRRARSICSAEDNAEWADRVRKLLGENSLCIREATTPSDYANAINQSDERFDIIVIDGSVRADCAKTAIPRLSKGGFIILDDSNYHPDAVDTLHEADLLQVDFAGFGPVNSYIKTTSFFFHREFQSIA